MYIAISIFLSTTGEKNNLVLTAQAESWKRQKI
jgi:hypothetical protein